MSAPLQLHDVAGSLPAPPFGQALDVLLGVVPLDLFNRPLLHFERPNERLDRDDDRVENADLSGIGQPVQHGDDPILLRVEPLLGPADDFCAFSHSFPRDSASMCGIEQRASQRSGSSADRVILASTALYSHASQQQQSADCRARSKISHTNSPAQPLSHGGRGT